MSNALTDDEFYDDLIEQIKDAKRDGRGVMMFTMREDSFCFCVHGFSEMEIFEAIAQVMEDNPVFQKANSMGQTMMMSKVLGRAALADDGEPCDCPVCTARREKETMQ